MRIILLLLLTQAAEPTVDNPEHSRWSSSKPGSWVMFEQPCGKNGELIQETYKVLERTAEKTVFECTKVENGFKYPLFKQEIPAKFPVKDPQGAEANKPDVGEFEMKGPGGKMMKLSWKKSAEGDEEIQVAGKTLKCHWIKIERRTDSAVDWLNDMGSAKTWYSKEVPGGIAKIEMTRWIRDNPPYEMVVVRVAKEWHVE